MTWLALAVVLVVFGPPVLLALTIVVLLALGLWLPDRPRLVRTTFWCPYARRTVTVEFLVPAAAGHPSVVRTCTAFRDPRGVVCPQRCRGLAEVQWLPPAGVCARWAVGPGATPEELPRSVGSPVRA